VLHSSAVAIHRGRYLEVRRKSHNAISSGTHTSPPYNM
jgi:hypothetical protein